MAQAEKTIALVTSVENLIKGYEWIRPGEDMENFMQVIITLGRECRTWYNGNVELEIQQLLCDNTTADDVIIYTDGSVLREIKSGWGFSARARGKIVCEQNGAYRETTSSMRMEIEAVTAAMRWLSGTTSTRAVVVSDSQSMLRKIKNGWLRHEWVELIDSSNLGRLLWIYCPGHAGVRGNERADSLASRAPIIGDITMDKKDVLKSLYDHFLRKDTVLEEDAICRFREFGIRPGESRTSRLRGRVRSESNQRATGTISMHTLRHVLGATEHLWVCPEC